MPASWPLNAPYREHEYMNGRYHELLVAAGWLQLGWLVLQLLSSFFISLQVGKS